MVGKTQRFQPLSEGFLRIILRRAARMPAICGVCMVIYRIIFRPVCQMLFGIIARTIKFFHIIFPLFLSISLLFAAKYLKSFFIVHHIITIYFCKGIYSISYLTNYRNTLYAFYIRRCIL